MSNIMTRERLEITGNLGDEPQLRYTEHGTAVMNLSICVDRYKGKDEDGKAILQPIWYRVPVFGKQAEDLASRLWKGCPVEVRDAKPNLRTFTRADGTTDKLLEVIGGIIIALQPLEQPTKDSEGWDEAAG
jgi:single-strand DNA-binding protein